MIVAKCEIAKAEGEKVEKAFQEATTVHVLSTRFNEPSEEVLAGVVTKRMATRRRMVYVETHKQTHSYWECDTDDEDGVCTVLHRSKDGRRPRRQSSSSRGGQDGHRSKENLAQAIATVEPGTCMVFDPNTTNAYIMDGNSNNANAIWLRNWREVGLENAREDRRLVHTGAGGWWAERDAEGGGEHGEE